MELRKGPRARLCFRSCSENPEWWVLLNIVRQVEMGIVEFGVVGLRTNWRNADKQNEDKRRDKHQPLRAPKGKSPVGAWGAQGLFTVMAHFALQSARTNCLPSDHARSLDQSY